LKKYLKFCHKKPNIIAQILEIPEQGVAIFEKLFFNLKCFVLSPKNFVVLAR